MSETFEFQAEIKQLLTLIINTFYSNKEIAIRELISNSSDALNKVKYSDLQSEEKRKEQHEYVIKIETIKDKKTVVIEDNGIGMTKAELINSLGTIAQSGTKNFLQKLADNTTDVSLIGQFGVGFYSAYLLAEEVVVVTKSEEDEQYIWKSDAGGLYTITKDEVGPFLKRGTKIYLKLKVGQESYLESETLKNVIKKHSQFISFPIQLLVEKEEEQTVTDTEDDDEDDEKKIKDTEEGEGEQKPKIVEEGEEKPAMDADDEEKPKIEEVEDEEKPKMVSTSVDKKKEKKTKKIKQVKHEWTVVNTQKPIWLRSSSEVTKQEYEEFYKSIGTDWQVYLAVHHFHVEGTTEFRAILFVPQQPPFNLFETNKEQKNIKLYVKRVFITEESKDLIPEYLNFVIGIIDSEDLPLNISRESLQQNKILKRIKKTLTKKCVEMFENIAENKEDFEKFYKGFGKNIKLGIHTDEDNRNKLARFLRYPTTKSKDPISLMDYVTRKKEGQDKIFYIAGESVESLSNSPLLEKFQKKEIEVLFMTEPIDEYCISSLKKFEELEFVNISKEGTKIDDTEEEKKKLEEQKKEYEGLIKKFAEVLGKGCNKVELTSTLFDTPCVLLSSAFGWSANMERIMKAQALKNDAFPPYMMSQKTLLLNPDHPILIKLKEKFMIPEEQECVNDMIKVLYQVAVLNSGFSLEDPVSFSYTIEKVAASTLGLSLPERKIPVSIKEEEKKEDLDNADVPQGAEMEDVE